MGVRRPEGHVTDPWNARMKETSRRLRRLEASSGVGQRTEWADSASDGVDGWMDGWIDGWVDGWVGGWMDGWMDGWMGGWMDG